MNRSIIFYIALTINLYGCQHFPLTNIQPAPQAKTNSKLEQLLKFGANFAHEFNENPTLTCTKFIKLHQEGDWRASWVLALTANKNNSEHCLNSEDAIKILTTLESRNKIYPELSWLNQFHLQLLNKIQNKTEKVTQLHDTIGFKRYTNKNQQQLIDELKEENQDLKEKLEALKNIDQIDIK